MTQKLSTGTGQVDVPQINSSGKVVWQQYDGSDWEIFFWNGSAVQQLTNNSTDDRNPKINDLGQVAWEHYDGTDWEIYFWDGSTTQQVTNNDTNDLDPEINGSGEITWKNQSTTTFGSGLPPSDILLWDGSTTQALAEKVDPFDAWAPCINDAGQVAWVGHSDINGSRILMWDGVAVQECPQYVSSDGFLPEHGEPRINSSGQVTWLGGDNSIYLYTHTPPALPNVLTAKMASDTTISLTWTDNSSNETAFQIWREDGSYGPGSQIASLAANSTSYTDGSGIYAHTFYSYRVRAANPDGTFTWSKRSTVDLTVSPAPPTSLSAATMSATQINLGWVDNSNNETQFQIWRATGGGSFAQVATVGANSTAYSDSTVIAGNVYTYQVRATNAIGASGWSNQATADTLSPAAPANLSAVLASATQINLTWTDNSNNETAFAVWRADNGGAYVRIAVTAPNVTSYSDSSVAVNNSYKYEVRATNNVGASAYSNEVTVDTLPLAAPTNLTASGTTATTTDLSWTDNSNNESAYTVWRALIGGSFSKIATLGANVTSYTDTGLTTNSTYQYEVRCNNNANVSPYSNVVTVVPTDIPPAAPTNLVATAVSSTQINLTWTDNSFNETAFTVWRWNGSTFVKIATLPPNTTSYSDTGLAHNTAYTYEVRCNNNIGASAYTNQASATTQP